MAQLLVSVRSAAEAGAALEGGADLIDVKEPAHGSLGRACEATVGAVCARVGGRRPVSAALGELLEDSASSVPPGLAFVKWGLAGCRDRPDWRGRLKEAARQARRDAPGCLPVAVAYADWERARSPDPDEVCQFACASGFGAFLLDTWAKDGRALLDWLPLDEIGRLCQRCRAAGVRVALAGSLGVEQIDQLRQVEPNWFAVRGAVCRDGLRDAVIDRDRVRTLADFLGASESVAIPEG